MRRFTSKITTAILSAITISSLLGCSATTTDGATEAATQHDESPTGREAQDAQRPPTADHHEGDNHQSDRHHHRFEDPERWARHFENPSRDEWQRPEAVLDALGLTPESRVADIGAATGYFPVRIARRVPQGRVWGIDIEPGMVRYLNERARQEGLSNLFALLGTPNDPLIPEPVDVILIVNTYHHIAERGQYFGRLRQHLRPQGRLVIVDYTMGDHPYGPPDERKIPPDQIRQELEASGYRLVQLDLETLPYQAIITVTPTD